MRCDFIDFMKLKCNHLKMLRTILSNSPESLILHLRHDAAAKVCDAVGGAVQAGVAAGGAGRLQAAEACCGGAGGFLLSGQAVSSCCEVVEAAQCGAGEDRGGCGFPGVVEECCADGVVVGGVKEHVGVAAEYFYAFQGGLCRGVLPSFLRGE